MSGSGRERRVLRLAAAKPAAFLGLEVGGASRERKAIVGDVLLFVAIAYIVAIIILT